MTDNVIDILEVDLKDINLEDMKVLDNDDPHLKEAIDAYEISLENEGIEVFYRGNTYLVCEKCMYLATYEDDNVCDDCIEIEL